VWLPAESKRERERDETYSIILVAFGGVRMRAGRRRESARARSGPKWALQSAAPQHCIRMGDWGRKWKPKKEHRARAELS